MKVKSIFAAIAVVFGAASLPAHAAFIGSVLAPGVNEIQDTDAERILRGGVAITSGAFAVGDIIQTVLRFDTINSQTVGDLTVLNGGPLPNSYQLLAISELQITAKFNVGTTTACTNPVCTLVFGAANSNLTTGSLVDVYERVSPVPGFSLATAPLTSINNIKSGNLIVRAGIVEGDDFWVASTLDNIAAAASLSSASPQAALGQFGLSLIGTNNLNLTKNAMLGGDGNMHDFVGNVSAYQRSPGANTDWLFSSNTSVQFLVPEPGSLALVGLALAGIGFAGRRKTS